jgi:hypothetical protein
VSMIMKWCLRFDMKTSQIALFCSFIAWNFLRGYDRFGQFEREDSLSYPVVPVSIEI